MSYIIVATVYTDTEENHGADRESVDARILNESPGCIEFDVRGEFDKQKELTLALCTSLVTAGFISFEIRHSY